VFSESRKSEPAQPKRSGSSRWSTRNITALLAAAGLAITPIVVAIISSSSGHVSPNPTIGAPQGLPPTTSAPQVFPGNNSGTNVVVVPVPVVPVPGQTGNGLQGAPMQDPAQRIPSSAAPSPALRAIKINPTTPVPRCATFEGTGDVPPGQTLWLMVFTPGSRRYYPKPVIVDAAEHEWTAKNVLIGAQDDPADAKYGIYATLIDNSDNELLQQNRSTGFTNLLGIKQAELSVSRNEDVAGCR
jgi:hypothetical protein